MLATIGFRVLSFCLLSRNVKVKIYKIMILPDVLCRCETWSVTLREEHRLRVLENRVLRRVFGLRGLKFQENGGSCTMRSFIIYTHPQISLDRSNQGE
jgi:hypothetical protein